MLDPTIRIHKNARKGRGTRAGAIMPMFALLLPVLLIFAGFAVNLAYMQLCSTELKIATDAAAHAGGRAMSLRQTSDIEASIDETIAQAELTAQANLVGANLEGANLQGADLTAPGTDEFICQKDYSQKDT